MDRYIEFFINHYILSIALLVVTYLLVMEIYDAIFHKQKSISALQAVTKINDETSVVLDVREAVDFATSHIENAINAPLSKLKEDIAKLERYKKSPVLLTCDIGSRSYSAAKILVKAGFEDVFILTGGMQAWEEEYKLPVKRDNKKKVKLAKPN